MATKKQKHAEALAKREEFLAEERRLGLEAQKKAHQKQERRRAQKEREEAEKQQNDDLERLINMMAMSMRRFPTDEEVTAFINGDDATRSLILTHQYEGNT